MNFAIPVPTGFDFKRTLLSHGWCDLPPFENSNDAALIRVLDFEGQAEPVTVTITGDRNALNVRASRRLVKRERASVERDVRHMFRLDEDLADFYSAVSTDAEFEWVARDGAGRLMRAPTLYEDIVKAICTTNCSWALTKIMVGHIVNNLGRPARDGRRAFPTPEVMAEQPTEFYRTTVRAGYRADYLKELAERVASGDLNTEAWLASELPTAELKRQLKEVKGVGDYAAETVLRLIGRYDGLALDSWVRGKFARTRNGGRKCDDKKIARFYSRFDSWSGLALWCDMTRDWFSDEKDEE